MISFSEAIYLVKKGKRISRTGWNGKGMYLFLVDEWQRTNKPNDKFPGAPFIAMKTVDDHAIPWLASQADMFANDWILV